MRRWGALVLLLGALGACGDARDDAGESNKRFADPAFGVTFEYPGEFEVSDDVSAHTTVGAGSGAKTKGLRLDEDNGIVVQRFDLDAAVSDANLAQIKPQLDELMRQAAGRSVPGERIAAGGLPGYEYELDVRQPAGARTRIVFLFDGKAEYTINCQYTSTKRRQIQDACRQALDTLERK